MNDEELLFAITEISKAISEPSIFDIIATGISVFSMITTIIIIYFNYRAVKAAKESVEITKKSLALTKLEMQKNIDVQLYDRRLIVANHIEQNNYCDSIMEVALLFGNNTCNKIKKIRKLLHEKAGWERNHEKYDRLLQELRYEDECIDEYEELGIMLQNDAIPPELYQEYYMRYLELDKEYSVLYDDTPDGQIPYDIHKICGEETRLDQEIKAMQKSLKTYVLKVMRQKLSLEAD